MHDALRRQIGQLFIVGFHGQAVDKHIETLIRAPYYVGQIVLFQRNVVDAEQLAALTRDLQKVAKDAGHEKPLVIGIDQENGLVTRVKPPVTPQLPGAMALSATGETEDARNVGKATAAVLRALGVNMNYGPVCDVNSNPENPVIGVRSFGDDPEAVGRLAEASWTGLRDGGVIPCVKHFPGHGDTSVDSHYDLPRLEKSWDQLEDCELIPFRRAIADGIEAIMTAHIMIGQDAEKPVTLDAEALRILRQDLAFRGAIISDCLEMNAIRTKCGGTTDGAVTALSSGCDCVMVCHTLELQVGALEAAFQAAEQGVLSKEQIDASFERVSSRLKKNLSWDSVLGSVDATPLSVINENIAERAKELYSRTTTLVRAKPGILPLNKYQHEVVYLESGDQSTTSGVVEYGQTESKVPDARTFRDILKSHNPRTRSFRFHKDDTTTVSERLLDAVKSADVVILATRNARLAPFQQKMAVEMASIAKSLIVVATCDPYDLLDEEKISTYLVTYEPTVAALEAAADVLYGQAAPCGTLPVQAPTLRAPFRIEELDLTSKSDLKEVVALWHSALPKYPVPKERLASCLSRLSTIFVARWPSRKLRGFLATHTPASSPTKASIIALCVDQSRFSSHTPGLATALLTHARKTLLTPPRTTLTLSSTIPRFFPGLPTALPPAHRAFFAHRGFRRTSAAPIHDLWAFLPSFRTPAAIAARARAMGTTFAVWEPAGEAECLAGIRSHFSAYAGWESAYRLLAQAGMWDQVMVACAADGTQVGWTLMIDPRCEAVWRDMAVPVCVGSAENTGWLACVGVVDGERGKGTGLALVGAAMEELGRRGASGVFVDTVDERLVGWYGKLGLGVWGRYEGWEWRGVGAGRA